jgi:hypothetical protein
VGRWNDKSISHVNLGAATSMQERLQLQQPGIDLQVAANQQA